MTQTELRKQNRIRIQQLGGQVLDGLERVLDTLKAETDKPKAPAAVARRQIANMMGVPKLCAKRACRRTHACQGEPLHCLQTVAFLLPEDAFDGLLRKQPARRRKTARRGPAPGSPRAA